VAILPNPVRTSPCGNVFPAQTSKNFHLGSGCQVTAPRTCLLSQWFDWSEAVNCHYQAIALKTPVGVSESNGDLSPTVGGIVTWQWTLRAKTLRC
jgi:hypothetical protein